MLEPHVAYRLQKDLDQLWEAVQKLKQIEKPTIDDKLIEDSSLRRSKGGVFWNYVDSLRSTVSPTLCENRKRISDGLLDYMSVDEKKFFTHDVVHVMDDIGIFGHIGYRRSSWEFLREHRGKKIGDVIVEESGGYYDVIQESTNEHIREQANDKDEAEEIRTYLKGNLALRELYSEKTLRNALDNWHDNFVKGVTANYFLFSYLADTFGVSHRSFEISDVIQSVQGRLTNSFFAFTQSEDDHAVTIEVDGGEGIYTETPGLLFSWVYNLTKNALKRAEDLYVDNRDFQGGAIKITVRESETDMYIAVSQPYDGIDLKKYAALGYEIVSQNADLAQQIPPDARRRYEAWIGSTFREGFGDMHISDITDLAFLANVSGAEISSPTSGIGLYATKTLVEEQEGKLLHFYNPDKSHYGFGEGFMIRLPKQQQRLAA